MPTRIKLGGGGGAHASSLNVTVFIQTIISCHAQPTCSYRRGSKGGFWKPLSF